MSGLKVDTRFLDLSAYYTALQTDALLAAVTGGSSLTNYYTKTQTDSLLAGKESSITAGTTSQYWRGDKTWQTLNTANVPELTNLYYTQARFDTAFSAKSTTNLSEGANLYYTDTRARASISESITGIDYNSSTGILSLTSGYVIPTTTQETNWNTAYSNRIISLTVTGSSGAATLSSNVLNIPTYTLSGLGGQPLESKLTSLSSLGNATTGLLKYTNGVASYDTSTYLTGNQTIILSGDVSGSGATAISATVTKINGTSLAGLATGLLKNTTSTGVPSIAVAGTDYIAGGVGTANYISKFSGSGVLANSQIFDNGGFVGFNTTVNDYGGSFIYNRSVFYISYF